jgi:maleate isomerase
MATSAALPMTPGSRGRIGVIQPAPGLVLEAEWSRFMPVGVAFPVTRVALYGATPADYAAMNEAAGSAAAILANARADVIAHACGVGSLYAGPQAEHVLERALSGQAGGIRVTGMAAASITALEQLAARRIAVITPYDDAINRMVSAYLEATGRTICAFHRFDVVSAVAAASLSDAAIVEAVTKLAADAPDADAIWMRCISSKPSRPGSASRSSAATWRCCGRCCGKSESRIGRSKRACSNFGTMWRRVPPEPLSRPGLRDVGVGRQGRRHQHAGVIVLGMLDDPVGRAAFDNLAEIHHCDARAQVPDRADVMGNEQI